MSEQPSTQNDLEEALRLQATEEGVWQGVADPRYEANTGMFGGWTAALLLQAVVLDARVTGLPSAITVYYVNRIPPGSDVQVRVTPVGGGRSISHWQSQIFIAGQPDVMAYASVVVARRKPTDGFGEWTMPAVSETEHQDRFVPPGTFGEQTLIRPIHGYPPFAQPNTTSLAWVQERSGRPMDAVLLTYLADAYPPRIWYTGTEFRPSATVTMSVYFHATSEEMERVGNDYVLSEATGTRAEYSTVGSQARLWSADGILLATTEQLSWFR